MKRLVEIANVVNQHAKSKGSAVRVSWEILVNLTVVVAGLVSSSVIQKPICQVLESTNDVIGVGFESEIRKGTTFVKVRLIDEVPS